MAITLALVPHAPNLGALYGCAIGIGFGSGVLNTIINVWIIEMWKEKSPPILQLPGLTFGIGTILSPNIIKPFLKHRNEECGHFNNTSANTTMTTMSTITTAVHSVLTSTISNTSEKAITHTCDWFYDKEFEEGRRTLLKPPFYILGVIQLICKFCLFLINC